MKITTQTFQNKPIVGITDEKSGEVLVPHKYFWIKKINNYLDLSLKNFEPVFLLYKNTSDFFNKTVNICTIKNGKANISKDKYENITAFYKGITIAQQNDKQFLLHIDEQQLTPAVADIFEYQTLLEDQYMEVLACLDGGLTNYGYIKKVDEASNKVCFSGEQMWPTNTELALMASSNFTNEMDGYLADWIGDFDHANGLCLIKNNEKLSFINRYQVPVCEEFDYVFSPQELANNGIDHIDDAVKYIEKSGKVFKLKFVGDFINEIINYPSLFISNAAIKEQIHRKYDNKSSLPQTIKNSYYFKMDEHITHKDAETQMEAMKDAFFPFALGNQNLAQEIAVYKALFGHVYSASVIEEEVNPLQKSTHLVPYKEGDKWGFATPFPFHKVVVSCQYDAVSKPMEGMYYVKIKQKWQQITIDDFKIK
jgi:hypothetical protein